MKMKQFQKKWALTAICAAAFTANANEVIELQIGAFLNVCSESKSTLECETLGLPENPTDFVKQIELQEVEGMPGLLIGVYSEKEFGFDYSLAIAKMNQEGAPSFYTIVASVGPNQNTDQNAEKLRTFMLDNSVIAIPGITSLVVDDPRNIQFVMHTGASSVSGEGDFRQPALIFGWDDLSENFATKSKMQNHLLR